MTWREFLLHKKAYDNKQVKEWERTRMISYLLYKANTTDKSPKSIKAFLPLPSDEMDEEKIMLTEEQLKETLKLYGAKK